MTGVGNGAVLKLLVDLGAACEKYQDVTLRNLRDLASRLAHRVQVTTDGHKIYLEAIEGAFGADVDTPRLGLLADLARHDCGNPITIGRARQPSHLVPALRQHGDDLAFDRFGASDEDHQIAGSDRPVRRRRERHAERGWKCRG